MPKGNGFLKVAGWGITLFLLSLLSSWHLTGDPATNPKLLSKAEQAIQIARQKPDSPAGKAQLALAYYARYEESADRQFLQRAVGLLESVESVDIPSRDYLLGIMYLDLKQDKLALKCLENYLQNHGDNQQAQLARGIALLNTGRYQEAADALQAFAKVNPGIADTYELLGQAYEQLGRDEPAKQARNKGKLLLERPAATGSHNQVRAGDYNKNHK